MREKPLIAALVKRLRLRVRLSQRELGELSDVSAAAIARIERGFDPKSGGPVKPGPDTLRRIARGLATSADGDVDNAAEQRIYRDLLNATGYDLPADSGSRQAEAPRHPFQEEIASLLKQIPDASIALTDLARGANDWDDDDREFVLGRLRRLAERYGRSQAAC